MLWTYFIFSSAVFLSLHAGAQLTENYFLQFQSPFVEVVTDSSKYRQEVRGQYPILAQILRYDFGKWTPTGHSKAIANDCEFAESEFQAQKQDLIFLREYFGRCDQNLQTGTNSLVANAYLTTFIKLHPSAHPYARHVMLHLPNGILLKGLLALKGDSKPRPLVILRLGIFSNTQEFFPERFLFLQLFEQSPFNFLILESLSGSEFVVNNLQFSVGGYDEGIQNYQVAQALSRPQEPLSKLIDSVHMMGVSMGGHGVLYSAILNELNAPRSAPKVISSFTTFCPLVNFKESLEMHEQNQFNMWLMGTWTRARLQRLNQVFPGMLDVDGAQNAAQVISHIFQTLDLQSRRALSLPLPTAGQERSAELRLPPSAEAQGFFAKNNWLPDFKNIRTPVLVFATEKDPIVPLALNSRRLPAPGENMNLAVITLKEGYHCSMPAAYNWRAMTQVLQNFVIKNSGLQWSARAFNMPADLELLAATENLDELSFQVSTEGLFVKREWIGNLWGLMGKASGPLDLTQTDWSQLQAPLNEDTQAMLRRWVSQNYSLQKNPTSKRLEIIWKTVGSSRGPL